jgi:hypothetical protein
VEVSVDNAAIADLFVDNEYVGKLPRAYPIYVDPGSHVIFARNNTASGSVRIEIKKGETRRIALHILPPPSTLAPPAESISVSTESYALGAGISLALMAGGIYMAETQRESPSGPPEYSYLWGPLIGGGAVGMISLAILFGATRTKQSPMNISAMILPARDHWHIGFRGTF